MDKLGGSLLVPRTTQGGGWGVRLCLEQCVCAYRDGGSCP